jgi:hypothetical protein
LSERSAPSHDGGWEELQCSITRRWVGGTPIKERADRASVFAVPTHLLPHYSTDSGAAGILKDGKGRARASALCAPASPNPHSMATTSIAEHPPAKSPPRSENDGEATLLCIMPRSTLDNAEQQQVPKLILKQKPPRGHGTEITQILVRPSARIRASTARAECLPILLHHQFQVLSTVIWTCWPKRSSLIRTKI